MSKEGKSVCDNHHLFHDDKKTGEKQTWCVIVLTVVMMAVEISAGIIYGSMALLADGWHMGTHAAALGITVFTYYYARKHQNDQRFAFGTGKAGVLGGFASAIILGIAALMMCHESVMRLITPETISFNEAIMVAVIGLVVNLLSAYMLHGSGGDHHHHGHSHGDSCSHGHDHGHHHEDHHDHNLRAAYLHVIADALTSVLAIFALLAGKYFNWVWMDPAMGIVGALVISKWAIGLLRETGRILMDRSVSQKLVDQIHSLIDVENETQITDLHLWKISSTTYAAVMTVTAKAPKEPVHYKKQLETIDSIRHITVEVEPNRQKK